MKLSKSPISILIAALSFSTVFVASVFTARSIVVARVGVAKPMPFSKDVGEIDIIVRKKPGNAIARKTNTEGSFTVGNLTPGLYEVSLVCKTECQRMNHISATIAGSIQFTFTGAKESPFKRDMTPQQLVKGVTFPFEIVARRNGEVTGKVAMLTAQR
jgi:hypothetical protein